HDAPAQAPGEASERQKATPPGAFRHPSAHAGAAACGLRTAVRWRLSRRPPTAWAAAWPAASCNGPGTLEHFNELIAFVHFGHDVRPTNEFPADVQLRDGRPLGKHLDAFTDLGVIQHIDGDQLAHTRRLENIDSMSGETALRCLRRPLHEQDNGVPGYGFANEILNVTHD